MRRALLLAALVLPKFALAQQGVTVEYSWRSQSLVKSPPLRSGQRVTLVIRDLNRVCFDYETTIAQQQASSSAAAFIPYLTGTGALQQEATKPAKPDESEKSPSSPRGAPAAAGTTRTLSSVKIDVLKVDSSMAASETLLKAGRAVVEGLRLSEKRAIAAHDTFVATACPGGVARGPKDLEAEWAKQKTEVDGFIDAVKVGQDGATKQLKDAGKSIELAKALLTVFELRLDSDATYRAWRRKPASELWLRGARAFLETANADLKQLGEALTTIVANKGLLATASPKLATAVRPDSVVRIVSLKRDTDQLNVTIKATGKSDVTRAKGTTIEDKLELPVTVAHRFSLSAGMLFTFLPESEYQRTSVLDADGKSYSTFLDTKGNRVFAFAPAVLSTVSLYDWHHASVAFSGGVAVRTVGEKTTPEYLLGPTVSVRDQVFLTVGLHVGRVERLLIGEPESVRKLPVPDEITRAGAVGSNWKSAWSFVLSYRVP